MTRSFSMGFEEVRAERDRGAGKILAEFALHQPWAVCRRADWFDVDSPGPRICEAISTSSQDDPSCRDSMMDDVLTAAVTTVIPPQIACLAPSSQLPRRRLPPWRSVCPESHKAPCDPELLPSSPPSLPTFCPPSLPRLPVSPESLDAASEPEWPPSLPELCQTSLGSVCPDSLGAACELELRPSSLPPTSSQPPCAVRKSKRYPSPTPPQNLLDTDPRRFAAEQTETGSMWMTALD